MRAQPTTVPPSMVADVADPAAYREALEFLWSRIDYERVSTVPYTGRSFKLDRMRRLLDMLGNPHERQQIVHIGGTKGKGSTAAMVSSVLAATGRRTGIYSSPHLDHLEERMAIDGQPCSQRDLVHLVAQVRSAVDRLDEEADESGASLGRPTYFEVATAMALLHFSESQVDATVLEVGLGGRLDSTNVCHPLVSVITNISLDHTKQLGSTLASIAKEKAGIIKPGVRVVSGVIECEARDVIRQTAAQRRSDLFELGRDFTFEYFPPKHLRQGETRGVLNFEWTDSDEKTVRYEGLSLALVGRHQAANAALAIAAIEVLRGVGWEIPQDALREGLAAASCPARVEVIGGEPTAVIDAAHNVASIEALLTTLDESFDNRRRVLVFATTQDKDAQGMLKALLPAFDDVVLTRYLNNPRYVPPEELMEIAHALCDDRRGAVDVADEPVDAWNRANELAGPDDLICVTGSFFIAAEIRRLVQG